MFENWITSLCHVAVVDTCIRGKYERQEEKKVDVFYKLVKFIERNADTTERLQDFIKKYVLKDEEKRNVWSLFYWRNEREFSRWCWTENVSFVFDICYES
jgi:hypothetical protein